MDRAFGSQDLRKIDFKCVFVQNVEVTDNQETGFTPPRVPAEGGDHGLMVVVHELTVLAAPESRLGGENVVYPAKEVGEWRFALANQPRRPADEVDSFLRSPFDALRDAGGPGSQQGGGDVAGNG